MINAERKNNPIGRILHRLREPNEQYDYSQQLNTAVQGKKVELARTYRNQRGVRIPIERSEGKNRVTLVLPYIDDEGDSVEKTWFMSESNKELRVSFKGDIVVRDRGDWPATQLIDISDEEFEKLYPDPSRNSKQVI